jgi:hypothetical protein
LIFLSPSPSCGTNTHKNLEKQKEIKKTVREVKGIELVMLRAVVVVGVELQEKGLVVVVQPESNSNVLQQQLCERIEIATTNTEIITRMTLLPSFEKTMKKKKEFVEVEVVQEKGTTEEGSIMITAVIVGMAVAVVIIVPTVVVMVVGIIIIIVLTVTVIINVTIIAANTLIRIGINARESGPDHAEEEKQAMCSDRQREREREN